MATKFVLNLSILISLLLSATARPGRPFHPCQTLILFSSSNSNGNPNSITFFFTQLDTNPSNELENLSSLDTRLEEKPEETYHDGNLNSDSFPFGGLSAFFRDTTKDILQETKQNYPDGPLVSDSFPFGLYSSYSASFRDRTKDILRVVGSLLFGLGCGALTAATLFLVWSLFVPERFSGGDEESDDDFSDYEDSPKKGGYVKIADPVKEVV